MAQSDVTTRASRMITRCALKVGHGGECLWIKSTLAAILGDCTLPHPHDTRGFTATLRLSIAQEELAEAIYLARGTAYALTVPAWRTMTPGVKDPYREIALLLLNQVEPQPRGLPPISVTGLRPVTNGRVIGVIEPDEGPAA